MTILARVRRVVFGPPKDVSEPHTFSLSNIAMTVFWFRRRRKDPSWARHLPAHVIAAALCVLILVVTVIQKFLEGGRLTLLITAALIGCCFAVRQQYRAVVAARRPGRP